MKPFIYNIEVAGMCNLRCPSCPVGNTKATDLQEPRPKGLMQPSLFYKILEKIQRDHPHSAETLVRLYSWGEPLLHPELAAFVSAINAAGLRSGISTNLNITRPLDRIIEANPYQITISLSGMYQNAYGKTHLGGQIERVKQNMIRISELINKTGSSTRVVVGYHVYRHNAGRDFTAAKEFSKELGFHFHPYLAWLCPLEKLLEYLDGLPLLQDRSLIDLLVVDPREHWQLAQQQAAATADCGLRSHGMTIGVDGAIELCSAGYDPSYNVASDFLTISHSEIQERRYESAMCARCMSKKAHLMLCVEWGGYLELVNLANKVLTGLGLDTQLVAGVDDCSVCSLS